MFKWLVGLVVLLTAYVAISFMMYMAGWHQPDMTQHNPSSPGFARCEGDDCLTSHPNSNYHEVP